MAVYTKINNKQIKLIEKKYNIGKIINYSGIKKGIENTNYILKTKKNKYILTIYEKRVQKKDIPYFIKLMSSLSKLKIKCPVPIKDKKGKYLLNLNRKKGCIVSFLEGKEKEQLTSKDCFEVGRNTAILHKATKKLKLYRRNSLSINSLGSILNKIENKINKLSKNLKDLMKDDLRDIKKKWPKKMPNGIIHGDLFVDNIFFNKGKFFGFIDFYFSANEFLSYELATCINALCFKKKNRKFVLDKKRSSNLLKGYQSIRKLSEIEKRNLNTLCRGSALRYLLTRSYDYLNTPKQAIIKIKDPKEYIDKLNFHRNLSSFKDYS